MGYAVDRFIVRPSHPVYTYFDDGAHKAKLLYNASMFRVRNHFTAKGKSSLTLNEQAVEDEVGLPGKKTGRVISACDLQKLMVLTHNPDYYAGLPSQTAQHMAAQAAADLRNWLKALRAFKKDPSAFMGKPRMPGYEKSRVKGFMFTNQSAAVKDGRLTFPKTGLTLPCRERDGVLKEVRVTPYHGSYLVCACYEVPDTPQAHGLHTAGVDFGVDNIMAAVSDTGESILFKGGAVKAENQWFNRRRAGLAGILTKGHPSMKNPSSKQLDALSLHRSEWMHDTFQKMSSRLIEWCLAHGIGTIVLGHNAGWKQKARTGRRNNQNFVYIPFYTLQRMIHYKAERAGITVVEQEESYTSKASFIDNDPIPVYGDSTAHAVFPGRRIQRGLYKSKDGILINADLNGAGNILRKYGAGTKDVSLSKLQAPLVIKWPGLNKRIPVKGTGAALTPPVRGQGAA